MCLRVTWWVFLFIRAVMVFLNSLIEHFSGTPSAIYVFVLFNLFIMACLRTKRKRKRFMYFERKKQLSKCEIMTTFLHLCFSLHTCWQEAWKKKLQIWQLLTHQSWTWRQCRNAQKEREMFYFRVSRGDDSVCVTSPCDSVGCMCLLMSAEWHRAGS